MVVKAGRDVPVPGTLRAQVTLKLSDLVLEQKGGRHVGELDLVFVQQAARDQPSHAVGEHISVSLNEDEYKKAMEFGLVRTRDLEMSEAGYYLRVVVRDASTGSLGSVNVWTLNLPR